MIASCEQGSGSEYQSPELWEAIACVKPMCRLSGAEELGRPNCQRLVEENSATATRRLKPGAAYEFQKRLLAEVEEAAAELGRDPGAVGHLF